MADSLREVKGVLTLALGGNQRFEDIIRVGRMLERYAVDGTIDKLLVDLTAMGYPDLGARLAAVQVAGKFYYNHVALVRNGSSLNNALVLFIARQSGHVREIESFSATNKAVGWLRHSARAV